MKKLSDDEVRKLGEELAELPKGCISQKRIRCKVTFYRQWFGARSLVNTNLLRLALDGGCWNLISFRHHNLQKCQGGG